VSNCEHVIGLLRGKFDKGRGAGDGCGEKVHLTLSIQRDAEVRMNRIFICAVRRSQVKGLCAVRRGVESKDGAVSRKGTLRSEARIGVIKKGKCVEGMNLLCANKRHHHIGNLGGSHKNALPLG
jgi:hypothetical protein